MTLINNNASSVKAWFLVDIEGIRKRFGTLRAGEDAVFDSWNPADTGTNRHVESILVEPFELGRFDADPLNGSASIPHHQFKLFDAGDELTDLLAVSNTPKAVTFLTESLDASQVIVKVADYSDLDTAGELFVNRETITYTGKDTDNASSTAEVRSMTAEGGSTSSIYDTALTQALNHWAGSVVTFTSGANNGEVRTVVVSTDSDPPEDSPYSDIGTLAVNRLYLDPDDPLPAAVANGDTYDITEPPYRLYDSALVEAEGYWKGAMVVITADATHPENVGEMRWVKDFSAARDTLSFYEPFPAVLTAATDYTMIMYWLTGATRGAYGSSAVEHSVLDKLGNAIPVVVTDKPTFIKTRRVRLYEYRQGCAESENQMHWGTIKDWTLDQTGKVFEFEVQGAMSILSRKVLYEQRRAIVAHKDVWGGHFHYYQSFSGNDFSWPEMKSGPQTGFSATEIYYFSQEPFPSSGNIRIGEEIIHYVANENRFAERPGDVFTCRVFKLAEYMDLDQVMYPDVLTTWAWENPLLGIFAGRGIFADKIGLAGVSRDWTVDGRAQTSPLFAAPAVCALMEEHYKGDEIVQACRCDDSEDSDFPRYDRIYFDNEAGAIGTLPLTITGAVSGYTATVVEYDSTNACIWVIDSDGRFLDDEEIGDGVAWTSDIVSVQLGDGRDLPSRNNPLGVLLQFLCSTGTGANGRYDTLPKGWGIEIDQGLVDIDGIEALRDRVFAKTKIDFVISEPTSLKDWAEENIFRFLQIFPYENNDGQISLSYLYTEPEAQAEDEDSPLTAIDASECSAEMLPAWNSGRDPVEKIVVRYNKNPVTDDFYGKLTVNMQSQSAEAFREGGVEVALECAVMYLGDLEQAILSPKDPGMPELLSRMLSPIWSRHTLKPAPIISTNIKYHNVDLHVGQLVKFTHPGLPNLRTGQRGLAGEYCQILGIQPRPGQGGVAVEIWQVGVHDLKHARKAPSAKILSYAADTPSAGKSTIELYAAEYNRVGTDCGDFIVDDVVGFVTSAYDPISGAAIEQATIEQVEESATPPYVVLSSNLANAPSDGDLMELADYDNAFSSRQTTRAFLADEERGLGAGPASAFKYQ